MSVDVDASFDVDVTIRIDGRRFDNVGDAIDPCIAEERKVIADFLRYRAAGRIARADDAGTSENERVLRAIADLIEGCAHD